MAPTESDNKSVKPEPEPLLQNGRPKQDPSAKTQRSAAADGRVYFSYADVHEAMTNLLPQIEEFRPDVIVAIGGGGFIPARMLRTVVKVPILAVSLELYDDATKTANTQVVRKQWFDETSVLGQKVVGGRVLVVDEVDDTRTTLEYCVKEVQKHAPAAVAVCVVHNKLKPKKGALPDDVLYLAGEDVPDRWNCYPWDAAAYGRGIRAHEALASGCASRAGEASPSEASPSSKLAAGDMGGMLLPFGLGVVVASTALVLSGMLSTRRAS